MTLHRRLLAAGVVVSLPVGLLAATVVEHIRLGDLTSTLNQVLRAQLNDQVRERCESDPVWFLSGALDGRLRPTDPKPPAAEPPPRPKVEEHAYEFYAYDDDYIASSPAAPRLSPEFKKALRAGQVSVTAPFVTDEGVGVQTVVYTSWLGPCRAILGRMRPWAHQRLQWWLTLFGAAATTVGVVVAVGAPFERRARHMADAARAAARSGWTTTMPADGHDELTAIGAAFNEASADLRKRQTELRDRDDNQRRLLARFVTEVSMPLEQHTVHLAESVGRGPTDAATGATLAFEAQDVALQTTNLLAAAALRAPEGARVREAVDLTLVLERMQARYADLARIRQVTLSVDRPATAVTVLGDRTLLDQLLANLVDNATRYNRAGGSVRVLLTAEAGTFRLIVLDDGQGVSEAQLAELTAIQRFRGDEGNADRVRPRGLGLAIVWEVAERHGFQLTLRHGRPAGVEAELTGSRTA